MADPDDFDPEFERLCPHVQNNPFIGPRFPLPKQAIFLGAHQSVETSASKPFESLYGGSAGGGKSICMLLAAAQYAWQHADFSAVIIRKTYGALIQPGGILDMAFRWWLPHGAKWSEKHGLWRFPSGAVVKMGYHNHRKDDELYQGGAYQLVCFDELGQWKDPSAYEWLRTRTRRADKSDIPIRILSTSNPGGPGHRWVQERFVGGFDSVTGDELTPEHPYFPASIRDNIYIDQESYIANLMTMTHPTKREQLLNGDWDAREPGDFFRAEWFGHLLDPADMWTAEQCQRIRWWDLAASEKPENARTAGVRMARSTYGGYALEDVVAFRKTPGSRDSRIAQVAQADGKMVIQGFEVEPGSGGIAQVEELANRLRRLGIKVVWKRPRAELTDREGKILTINPTGERGKQARWAPVASCAERGWHRRGESRDVYAPWYGEDEGRNAMACRDGIRLYAGPWVRDALDELEGLPDKDQVCDIADAMAGAWAWLYAHPVGLRQAAREQKELVPAEIHNIHPEERPRREDQDRSPGGRWRP